MLRLRRLAAPRRISRGMTLIEIMIAAAISMIVILAVVAIFQQAGELVSSGRAAIEMAGQVRRVSQQFRDDIAMVTVPTSPWPSDEAAPGYTEILEGPNWDGMAPATQSPLGDTDDVIMFTARSRNKPFVGFFNGVPIESHLAEIVWWTAPLPSNTSVLALYRRTFLIRPDLNVSGYTINNSSQATAVTSLATFYRANDVSVRVNGTTLVANTLADLTKRENRFGHNYPAGLNSFPYPLNPAFLRNNGVLRTGAGTVSSDVMLTNVASFDVKVFDPTALVQVVGGLAVAPDDPGYGAGSTVGMGAYVDLGYGAYRPAFVASSRFSGPPASKSRLQLQLPIRTSCTWSSHYERNGVNEDGDAFTDEGTDGLDNDGVNGVDDANELETSPPYPFPLRSLQVKFRVADITTQKVRQVTVQQDFLRE